MFKKVKFLMFIGDGDWIVFIGDRNVVLMKGMIIFKFVIFSKLIVNFCFE